MQTVADRKAQALRGLFSATFATGMALCMHVLAGGSYPSDFTPVALALIASAGVGVLVARSQASTARLSLTAGFSQLIFHQIFMLTGTHHLHTKHTPAASAITPGANTHHHFAHAHTTAETSQALATSTPASNSFFDARMLLAHAIAALVTIIVISRYEHLSAAIIELLYLVIVPLAPRIRVLWQGTPPHKPTYPPVFSPLPQGFIQSPQTYRGPPTPSFV